MAPEDVYGDFTAEQHGRRLFERLTVLVSTAI